MIDYSGEPRWSGKIELTNLRYQYRLTIQSVSTDSMSMIYLNQLGMISPLGNSARRNQARAVGAGAEWRGVVGCLFTGTAVAARSSRYQLGLAADGSVAFA